MLSENQSLGDALASAIACYARPNEPMPAFTICHAVARNSSGELLWENWEHNLVTDSGRNFAATQAYGSSPGANGLNYIGLSLDALTETATSTALSTEIAANGFTRAQATTITLPTSVATTTTTDTGGTNFNSAAGTTGNVASTANMVSGSLLLIDSELIIVGTVASSTQTTGNTRAAYGTTGAAHTNGATVTIVNTTILSKLFTATGAQTIQKAALFSASSSGTMGHVASLGGSRSLLTNDTLTVTFYVCLG